MEVKMLLEKLQKNIFLLIAILASVGIILTQSFLVYMYTRHGLLLQLIWIIFYFIAIWSILYLIRNLKTKKVLAVMPVIILIATLLLANFVRFDRIEAKIEFKLNYNEMIQVVDLVSSGELTPDFNGRIVLPTQYEHLSNMGAIFALNNNGVLIVYFTPLGIGNGKWSTGYVYRSDGQQLSEDDLSKYGTGFAYIEQLEGNWFYTEETP